MHARAVTRRREKGRERRREGWREEVGRERDEKERDRQRERERGTHSTFPSFLLAYTLLIRIVPKTELRILFELFSKRKWQPSPSEFLYLPTFHL